MNDKKIILSMATMPCRKKRLEENLPAILGQSYHFDMLVLNVNSPELTDDDMEWYYNLAKQDERIIVNKADAKWRSCNKLLPTLQKYPEDVIITIDDDIYYPVDCVKYLVEEYKKNQDCIIAHEIQPLNFLDNGFITYHFTVDCKLLQKEWGKYLSNCTLFPPHVFDGTDLFDYDKMMLCVNGIHDELWFWAMSTINKVQCIGLNYVYSFSSDVLTPWEEDEFKLTDFINTNDKINSYMVKINKLYGEKLHEAFDSKPVTFNVHKDNVLAFIMCCKQIFKLYNYKIVINLNNLTNDWAKFVRNEVSNYYKI